MKTVNWLDSSTALLKKAGIGTARLDCLVLLEDELGKDRSYLLAHPEHHFQEPSLERLDSKLHRRIKHEPLAYIRGKSEFYGREFYVDRRVLEPRPESETMIELLKQLVSRLETQDSRLKVVDVGTGSGALAITAKIELPETEVMATDIDPKCLAIARKNAKKYNAKIKFHRGDLLEPLRLGTRDWGLETTIVMANLPYVPARHHINKAASHEPAMAIYGGGDGLALYRRLFGQMSARYAKPRYVLTEALPYLHAELQLIAENAGFRLHRHEDFIQVFESI